MHESGDESSRLETGSYHGTYQLIDAFLPEIMKIRPDI